MFGEAGPYCWSLGCQTLVLQPGHSCRPGQPERQDSRWQRFRVAQRHGAIIASTGMTICSKRLARRASQISFPLLILSATGNTVADFVERDEFVKLAIEGAIVATGSRRKLRTVRWASESTQVTRRAELKYRPSHHSRSIASVDLIRSEAGYSSWVMRIVTQTGELKVDSSFDLHKAA